MLIIVKSAVELIRCRKRQHRINSTIFYRLLMINASADAVLIMYKWVVKVKKDRATRR